MITTRWTKGDMLEKLDENMIFISQRFDQKSLLNTSDESYG